MIFLLRLVSQSFAILSNQTRFLLELTEESGVLGVQISYFLLKIVNQSISFSDFFVAILPMLLHFLLHNFAIFEDDFESFLQFDVLLLFVEVLLFKLLHFFSEKLILFLQFSIAFDLILQLFICLGEFDLDKIDLLLRLLKVLLDAALLVGDLIL